MLRKQLTIVRQGALDFLETELADPGPEDVRIRPELSALKNGTEKIYYEGGGVFAGKDFDRDLRAFVPAPPGHSVYPKPVGSMLVGEIVEAGANVQKYAVGERVFCWGPVADLHQCREADLHPLGAMHPHAALCVDPGFFALAALHDADLVYGGKAAVFGLGAIALLLIQFLKKSGVEVYAASSLPKRRELAKRFGADKVIDTTEAADPALAIKEMTRGGVDVAFEAAGQPSRLQQAIRSVRMCGSVVSIGFYPGDMSGVRLGEEFVHNRVTIKSSSPAWRWQNTLRLAPLWDRDRIKAAVIKALSEGEVSVEGLLDPIVPFDESLNVLDQICDRPQDILKVGISH